MPPLMLMFAMLSVGYIIGVWAESAIYRARQSEHEDGLSKRPSWALLPQRLVIHRSNP
jgi:hypothetical protein